MAGAKGRPALGHTKILVSVSPKTLALVDSMAAELNQTRSTTIDNLLKTCLNGKNLHPEETRTLARGIEFGHGGDD